MAKAKKPRRKPGRFPMPRSMREVAEKRGYTPGDYYVQQLLAVRAQIEEWESYLRVDKPHPDFGDRKPNEIRAYVATEKAALMVWEEKILPYFYPKHSATEISGKDGGPVATSLEVIFK